MAERSKAPDERMVCADRYLSSHITRKKINMLVRVSIIQETFSISIKNFQFLSQNIFISIFILVRKEKRKQKIVIVTDTRIYFTQLLLGRGRNLTLTLPISNWCIRPRPVLCLLSKTHNRPRPSTRRILMRRRSLDLVKKERIFYIKRKR